MHGAGKMKEENHRFLHIDSRLIGEQKEKTWKDAAHTNSCRSLLTVSVWKFGSTAALIPLVSFASCVVLSLTFNFHEVTRTHCNVANYIPSISAATGDFTPQKYIWRIGIALHSLPNIGVAFVYYNYYADSVHIVKNWTFRMANRVNTALHTVENFALLALTYISSKENHDVHECCFIVFMVTSMIYMLLTCVLFNWTARKPMTEQEYQSYKWKVGLLLTNYSSFALAVYFFFRHNWYCEPGVYSLFALCEYVTIMSNIGFHSTVILDCRGRVLTLVYDKDQTHKIY